MLFCFILISNLAVQGQNYFNIKLGLVLADQTNTNGSFRAGLNTGFTYDYKVAPSIWIQSGLEYAGRGTNLGVVNNVTQFKTNIKYIEVPIFVKYKYSFKPSINWAIYGGPSVAFAVDASSSFFRIAQPATIPLPIGEGGVSRTDLAINIGGEYLKILMETISVTRESQWD